MAVSSVSFGNSAVFADLINKPQAYQTKPNGATGIAGEKKSHKAAKIGVGVAAAVIAAAVGLVAAAKTGKLGKLAEKVKADGLINKSIKYVDKTVNEVGKKADKIINGFGDKLTAKLSTKGEKSQKLAIKIKTFLNKKQNIWGFKFPSNVQFTKPMVAPTIDSTGKPIRQNFIEPLIKPLSK